MTTTRKPARREYEVAVGMPGPGGVQRRERVRAIRRTTVLVGIPARGEEWMLVEWLDGGRTRAARSLVHPSNLIEIGGAR